MIRYLYALFPMIAVQAFNIIIQYHRWNVYKHWPWFDHPMHTLGGFVTAWTAVRFYRIFQDRNRATIQPQALFYAYIIGMTALVGVLWEIYEFIHDKLYPWNLSQASIAETMYDLVYDLIGASVLCIILIFINRKRSNHSAS